MPKDSEGIFAEDALIAGKSTRKPILRRLYDWMLSWADTPYGTPALFVLSLMEMLFFPIPPDILQIALSAGRPGRAFFYATVNLFGSLFGALLGYLIGAAFWTATQDWFFAYVFTENLFHQAERLYRDNAFWTISMAAFTPLPDKVFTVAGGVCRVSLATFTVAMIFGRGLRFYLLATLMFIHGATVKEGIEKYFDKLAVLFTILLIGGFVLLKFII